MDLKVTDLLKSRKIGCFYRKLKSCIKVFFMDTSSCIVKLPDKPIRFHRLHEEVFLWMRYRIFCCSSVVVLEEVLFSDCISYSSI